MALTDYTPPMQQALALAERALPTDVPVGCVILNPHGVVIGEGYNRREVDLNPAGHAEVLAVQAAAKTLGNWRLTGCVAVVTLEPCRMCCELLVQSRVAGIVYGASDPLAGGVDSRWKGLDGMANPPWVLGGVLGTECQHRLHEFFRHKRQQPSAKDIQY